MACWMGMDLEKKPSGESGMDQQGPKARLMAALGNAPGTLHRWKFSAKGAVYHVDDRSCGLLLRQRWQQDYRA